MSAKTRRVVGIFSSAILLGVAIGGAGCSQNVKDLPLWRTYEAHGGIDEWRRQRALTYTLEGFPLSPQVAKPNTATVDLHNRHNRIEGAGFVVGFDGKQAWSTPGPDAVGLPPRFFTLGSFYFIGMPFVFADPGVVVEDKGKERFRGKTYRVAQVRYEAGIGYSSEDAFMVFIDPKHDRLALIHHSVTESPDVDRVTWVFDDWQQVAGLVIPSRMTFYSGWNPNDPGKGASFTVENARMSAMAPDPAIYNPPSGAVIE